VRHVDAVEQMIERCVALYGRIDVLFNNAGTLRITIAAGRVMIFCPNTA
jgi:NAD(P)-dependent dehydrogenase (short-subunit alcohol dehydrogenase family)